MGCERLEAREELLCEVVALEVGKGGDGVVGEGAEDGVEELFFESFLAGFLVEAFEDGS